MSVSALKSFEATYENLGLSDIVDAILENLKGRQGLELIKPAHHPKSVAAEIYFGAPESSAGSFYLVDINKDNTLCVAHVTRHADKGQACSVEPNRHNICGKGLNEILDLMNAEIQRVNPVVENKREQGVGSPTP